MNIKKYIPLHLKKYIKNKHREITLTPKYKKLTSELFLSKNGEKRIILIGTPNYGNLGDHAITVAERQFIEDRYKNNQIIEISMFHYEFDSENIKKNITNDDIILIQGGGFIGNLWIEAEYMVRDVLDKFPENEILIMPQTMFFDDKYDSRDELEASKSFYNAHDKLTIFLRERQSYDFVKENFSSELDIRLVPDIVTYMEFPSAHFDRQDVLYVFRNDKERVNHSNIQNIITRYISKLELSIHETDTVIPNKVDTVNRIDLLNDKLTQFSKHKLIVTDRLHGMIFALITGSPCIALNNSSGKVKGVFEWISESKHISIIDQQTDEKEAEQIIAKLLQHQPRNYDNKMVLNNFKPLISKLDSLLF